MTHSQTLDHFQPPPHIDYGAVRHSLERLLQEDIAGAALRQQLAQIAENYRCNPRQVEQLYQALAKEHDQRINVTAAADSLEEITTISSAQLPIELGHHGDGG